MPVIDHLDLAANRIYLAAGVREYHPVEDIYREVRTLRRMDESLRGFDCPIFAAGNVAKGGGRFTPRYAIFRGGWKIVPEDTSHTLFVTGEQLTDEGEAGQAAIDFEPLSPTSKVVVQYEPPAAEVLVIETDKVVETVRVVETERVVEVPGKAPPSVAEIWGGHHIETGFSPAAILRLIAAILLGCAYRVGVDKYTVTFRSITGDKDRVVAKVDRQKGTRDIVGLDGQ